MRFKYLWPAILWSLVILFITLTPGDKLPEVGIFQVDKLVHFFVFGLLMFLSSYGLFRVFQERNFTTNGVTVAAVYSIGLGLLVEVLQLFVPNRSFSVADVIANTIGAGIGYLVFRYYKRKYML